MASAGGMRSNSNPMMGGTRMQPTDPAATVIPTTALARPAFARAVVATMVGLLPYTDLVLLDIKALDPDWHRRLTGVSNEVILANAVALADSDVDLVVRVPIIPGQNDDEKDLRAVAHFLSGLPGLRRVELLPYNRMAQAKYSRLGLDYALKDTAHAAVGGDADGADVVHRLALPRVRDLGPGRA